MGGEVGLSIQLAPISINMMEARTLLVAHTLLKLFLTNALLVDIPLN